MCLLVSLMFLGPRFGIILYWLGWPARWEATFDTAIVPIIGFFLAPWLTLTWLLVAPDGVESFDYVLLFLAGALDLFTLGGGGRQANNRRSTAAAY